MAFDEQTFNQFLAARDDPDWVVQRRKAAFEAFASMPMPERSHEEWRRTDIRTFSFDNYVPLGALSPTHRKGQFDVDSVPVRLFEGTGVAGHRVVVDGVELERDDPEGLAESGVVFCTMDEAVRKYPDLVRPLLLTRAVDPTYDKFAAAHAAFWSGGLFLYVPRNVVIDRPLHVVLALATPGAADLSHTLIVLEEGAEATLFSELVSPPDIGSGLHVGATEVLLGPRSRLRLVQLEDFGLKVWNFRHQRALVGRDAALHWAVGALGSKLSKVNQEVVLEARGAEADVSGIMFGRDRQHLSYHTRQLHLAGETRSDLLYRGALTDRSRVVWRGMIRVEKGALKTDAYQRNDNLILSDHARADSIPGLEIEADDVRCTHGATAGHVDPDQVFYARSRGIDHDEAVHLIVEGFFTDVIERIQIPTVRAALRAAVAEKLGFRLGAAEEAFELAVV